MRIGIILVSFKNIDLTLNSDITACPSIQVAFTLLHEGIHDQISQGSSHEYMENNFLDLLI